jgi:hypothetical protein
MEKKKKGDQFRILDYAKLPEKPVSPDLKKIFLISLVAGLGIGIGFIFLLDFFNGAVQRKEELAELGVPVLVTIPRIYNERTKLWMKVNTFASLCSLLAAGVMAAGFAFVAFSDRFP